MVERGMQGQSTIVSVIERFAQSEDPVKLYVSRSLNELYQSGEFKTSILRGYYEEMEPLNLQALRIVGLHTNGLMDNVLVTQGKAGTQKRALDILETETKSFLSLIDDFGIFVPKAIREVSRNGFQTLAAMRVSRTTRTGRQIVEVHYPLIYGQMFQIIGERADKFGTGMASFFLKSIPFGKEKKHFELPSGI